MSPREWDNIGTIWAFHRRYSLGDPTPDWVEGISSQDDLFKRIKEHAGEFFYLPVYMYDHSGITISTKWVYPFNDPWDAGQLGIIWCSHQKMKAEGIKGTEKLKKILESEMNTYDKYLRGEVYGYVVEDEDGNSVDSCWGFIGDIEYCFQEGAEIASKERSWKEKFEESMVNLFEDRYFTVA